MKEQPNLGEVPAGWQRLLRKCLEKDPKRRLRDIGDAWDLIDAASKDPASTAAPWRAGLPWAVAALAVLGAGAIAVIHFREAPAAVAAARFQVDWPAPAGGGAMGGARFFQLSPNGRYLAVVAHDALWVRALDALEATRLDRTQGVTYPFWSPDSESIGFFQGGQLKTMPRTGGAARTICDTQDGRGGTWSPRGIILFAGNLGQEGLSRVSEQGGAAVRITQVGSGGTADAHRYPQFLSDGNRFIYLYLAGKPDIAGVYVGSLDGTAPVRVLDGMDSALFAPSSAAARDGYLLFRRQNALMAQAFDARTLKVSGGSAAVAPDVGQGENTGYGAFSVSSDGTLAHTSAAAVDSEIVWLDRSGARQSVVTPRIALADFAASPDERRVAISVASTERGPESEIWVQSIGGSPSKFTFGPNPGWLFPVWSPKGDQIAYATYDLAGQAGYEIRRKPANMAGTDELLLRSGDTLFLWDWSPDGKTLVFSNGGDLKLLPVAPGSGDRKATVFAKTPMDDRYAQFSPDGRWMAYSSGDRRQAEIYVQPIPATGSLWQISKGGGTMPRWRRDSKELYYRAGDGMLVAVTIGAGPGGAFEFSSTPQRLFPVPSTGNTERYIYQPSADGKRFMVAVPVAGSEPPIVVTLNWAAAIKR